MAACLAGKKVRFFRVTELITTLIEARDEKALLRMRSLLGDPNQRNEACTRELKAPDSTGIDCCQRLGGLLKHYCRKAA